MRKLELKMLRTMILLKKERMNYCLILLWMKINMMKFFKTLEVNCGELFARLMISNLLYLKNTQ